MPSIRTYNPGSIIYFQSDRGEEVFVLQKGKIELISSASGEGAEKHKEVKVGEFFGVKSSLGRYPREETAQAMSHTSLVVFGMEEFKKYAIKNTRLSLKMLQVFSNELRGIHSKIRSILKVDEEQNSCYGLLHIGETFHKEHNFSHASHAYRCYLKYAKDGKNRERTQQLLAAAQRQKAFPADMPPPVAEEWNHGIPKAFAAQDEIEEKQEMLDAKLSEMEQNLQKAQKAAQAKDWEALLSICLECLKRYESDAGVEQGEKRHALYGAFIYEASKAYIESRQFSKAEQHCSLYLKKYPSGEHIRKLLYQLALAHEMQDKYQQSQVLYRKLATMPPHDDLNQQARRKLEKMRL